MRLSVLMLFAASTAGAAPPMPKDEKPDELYFPVQVGAKRVTALKNKFGPPMKGGSSQTVTKVEEKDGKYTVTVEGDSSAGGFRRKSEQVLIVSKDGVFRNKTLDGKESPEPLPLLKLPHKEGATWSEDATQNGRTGPEPVKVTFTMGKIEEVEVPAGKYKSIRVDQVIEAGGGTQKTTYWYAAGVGMVKLEAGGSITELTEFTPGKDPKK
jgi:hypothetical protein